MVKAGGGSSEKREEKVGSLGLTAKNKRPNALQGKGAWRGCFQTERTQFSLFTTISLVHSTCLTQNWYMINMFNICITQQKTVPFFVVQLGCFWLQVIENLTETSLNNKGNLLSHITKHFFFRAVLIFGFKTSGKG